MEDTRITDEWENNTSNCSSSLKVVKSGTAVETKSYKGNLKSESAIQSERTCVLSSILSRKKDFYGHLNPHIRLDSEKANSTRRVLPHLTYHGSIRSIIIYLHLKTKVWPCFKLHLHKTCFLGPNGNTVPYYWTKQGPNCKQFR